MKFRLPYLTLQNFAEALFSISLGTAVIPRRNENKGYGIFFFFGGGGWGANKVHYGRCASGVQVNKFSYPWCSAARVRQVINSGGSLWGLDDYIEMLQSGLFNLSLTLFLCRKNT